MKRACFMIAALLLIAMSATACNFSFGAKAGVAFANQDFDYSNNLNPDLDYRTGFQAGVFAEIPLCPYSAVQLNAWYVPAGLSVKVMETSEEYPEGTGNTLKIKSRIDYIAVPLLLKFQPLPETISPYLVFGPRVNFQVGCDKGAFSDVYDHLRKVTFGLTLGAGADFPVSPKTSVLIEFSYSPDFTNILKAGELPPDATLESVKNRTFSILAGVRFR
jgi:opacity protein-like surface antigen